MKYSQKDLEIISKLKLPVSAKKDMLFKTNVPNKNQKLYGTINISTLFIIINGMIAEENNIKCPDYDILRNRKLMKLLDVI